MTSKKRLAIQLQDLLSFQFECVKCGSVLSVPIARIDAQFPKRCPNCQQSWGEYSYERHQGTSDFLINFSNALRMMSEEMGREKAGFTFALEISPEAANPD